MPTPPTPADLRTRIEAILAADARIETVIEDEECVLTDMELPAVIVMIRQGENVRTKTGSRQAQRTVQIGAYLSRICDDSLEEQRTALLAAEALLDVIPDIFSHVDRLRLNGVGLGNILEVSEMTDGGLEMRGLGEETYFGGTYELTVTVKRN